MLVLLFLPPRRGCWRTLLVVLAELPASLGRGVGQGGAVMSAVGYLWGILTVAIAVTVMDCWPTIPF